MPSISPVERSCTLLIVMPHRATLFEVSTPRLLPIVRLTHRLSISSLSHEGNRLGEDRREGHQRLHVPVPRRENHEFLKQHFNKQTASSLPCFSPLPTPSQHDLLDPLQITSDVSMMIDTASLRYWAAILLVSIVSVAFAFAIIALCKSRVRADVESLHLRSISVWYCLWKFVLSRFGVIRALFQLNNNNDQQQPPRPAVAQPRQNQPRRQQVRRE